MGIQETGGATGLPIGDEIIRQYLELEALRPDGSEIVFAVNPRLKIELIGKVFELGKKQLIDTRDSTNPRKILEHSPVAELLDVRQINADWYRPVFVIGLYSVIQYIDQSDGVRLTRTLNNLASSVMIQLGENSEDHLELKFGQSGQLRSIWRTDNHTERSGSVDIGAYRPLQVEQDRSAMFSIILLRLQAGDFSAFNMYIPANSAIVGFAED